MYTVCVWFIKASFNKATMCIDSGSNHIIWIRIRHVCLTGIKSFLIMKISSPIQLTNEC